MASRVVAAEVREVIDTNKDDGVLEENFIDTAHLLIEENLSGAGHSEAMLKKIELYLSAHFVALTEEGGGIIEDKVGDAYARFSDIYKAGLRQTRYGLQALALDTSGTLEKLSTGKLRAEFRVV